MYSLPVISISLLIYEMGIKFSLYQMVSVRIKRADSHKELSLVSDIIYMQINVSNYDKNNYPTIQISDCFSLTLSSSADSLV